MKKIKVFYGDGSSDEFETDSAETIILKDNIKRVHISETISKEEVQLEKLSTLRDRIGKIDLRPRVECLSCNGFGYHSSPIGNMECSSCNKRGFHYIS